MPIFRDSESHPKIPTAEIQDRLDSHKSGMEEQQLHSALKHEYKQLISHINENIVDSREKALALTQLEDSFMWLGKAIFTPDRTEKVSQSSDEEDRLATIRGYNVWMFDGARSDEIRYWLGEAFAGYSYRNISGKLEDEIILNLQRLNGQGYEGPVRQGDVIERSGEHGNASFTVRTWEGRGV
jgi:hypothetical protein